MAKAFYNEHDRFAAAWLRELIKAGLIADGVVDERDIQQIEATELREFTQCHFFAGIGVWSYALRAAGWSDDTPVWTGSCPCQSFSASGKREGFSDERHLWPAWFRLLRECRPDTVFGEQVASKDGLAWFDIVSSDLEGEGYAVGAADTCAAGYGAPMLSQRIYFVGEATGDRCERRGTRGKVEEGRQPRPRIAGELPDGLERSGSVGIMESTAVNGLSRRTSEAGLEQIGTSPRETEQRLSSVGELGASNGERLEGQRPNGNEAGRPHSERSIGLSDGAVRGFWGNARWIWCWDERQRPIEPSTFPLAYESPARVGRLRGYGNALCAEQAKGFVEAFLAANGGGD